MGCRKCSGGGERGGVGNSEQFWPHAWLACSQIQPAGRAESGSVRVAEGGSEDVGGPKISARDEARHLSLGGVVAGLGSSVNKSGDRVLSLRCPGIQSGRQHKTPVHRAWRSPGAAEPN